jgi:tetratricopeptide (TPR) repeat protein
LSEKQAQQLAERCLYPGLRQVLRARDLCPLLPMTHARLAHYVEHFEQADPRSVYMQRVKQLAPVDPQLWYFCGLQELKDDRQEEAWTSWRRSLQLSHRYLEPILDRAAVLLAPNELLDVILPDDPRLLLAAAMYLFPQPEAAVQRGPLLRKAVSLLEGRQGRLDADQCHTLARLHVQLAQPREAIAAYRASLAADPLAVATRHELAQLLYEQGRFEESRREVRMILGQRPSHSAARSLKKLLAAQRAAGK